MIETKNYDLLIRVFAKLDAPGWKLVIIGSDSQKQNIMSELNLLVRNLNLEGRVELPGTQNNVDDFYLKAKIFAFSSSSEGFPNVVGEAMAAGMAVVSFDCVAGPSDIITNDVNGFLVPVFDEAVFQDKIQQLVNNKNLRIRFGIEAIKGMARFSVPSISTRFLQTILSDYEDSAN
jgi:glycosyltransferase involved in cell wall biosynthesis